MASDRRGAAKRPGRIGDRDYGPGHLCALGPGLDRRKRRAALLVATPVLQQTYSIKFSDFALEFYTFVADNYVPFYSLPIECTDRAAAFVLDGLLYYESELEIEKHYTDTQGYTEINFDVFAMLGLRFCPRIRGVQHQRIYRTDPNRDYGWLSSLIRRADQTIWRTKFWVLFDSVGQRLRCRKYTQ